MRKDTKLLIIIILCIVALACVCGSIAIHDKIKNQEPIAVYNVNKDERVNVHYDTDIEKYVVEIDLGNKIRTYIVPLNRCTYIVSSGQENIIVRQYKDRAELTIYIK